jgi:serine protease Do
MFAEVTSSHNPIVEAIKRAKDAVVSVSQHAHVPAELSAHRPGIRHPSIPPEQKKELEESGGSGFFVSKEGLVLTNKHIVRDTKSLYTVALADNTTFEGKVVSRDPINDIAVLKIVSEDPLPVAPLGNSSELELGETLIAIGNALGTFQNTV